MALLGVSLSGMSVGVKDAKLRRPGAPAMPPIAVNCADIVAGDPVVVGTRRLACPASV